MGDTQSSMQEEPEPGDLIEIFRGIYKHWGVYVGGRNREMVHLTVPDGALGVSASGFPSAPAHSKNGQVKKEPLSTVAGGLKYRVNNQLDKTYKPRPAWEIVCDAEDKVGEEMPYNLLQNNCEHFATDLRYGVRKCKQVDEGVIIGSTALGGMALLAGVALAGVFISKALEKREEDDEYE